MKILFTTNIPSPYRVNFFNELGKYCELTVIFERKVSDSRNDVWKSYKFTDFNGILLNGINIGDDKSIALEVIKYLKRNKFDFIVVSNPLTPTGMIATAYLRMKKLLYAIEGDGAFVPEYEKKIKYYIKRNSLRGAFAYFSTCANHDKYYEHYAGKDINIYRYPFSSIYMKNILDSVISREKKTKIKKSLGIKESKMLLTIGQFIERKGFDLLLKAMPKLDKDIGLYMIGGYSEEYERMVLDFKLSNVHFICFKDREELQNYMDASDLFILPTREDVWGLVIIEAMARGLPIITTQRCNAGLQLVRDDKNGYIIPVEDVSEIIEKTNKIINNKDIENMGKYSLNYIQEYTIEKMAEIHLEYFKKVLN